MSWVVEPIVRGLAVPVASFDGTRFYCARSEDAEVVVRILNQQEHRIADLEAKTYRCNICGGLVTYDGTPPSVRTGTGGRA